MLMTDAWPEWYGPEGRGSAACDIARRTRNSGLPFGIVALAGGRPVGTVALDRTSFGEEPGEGPWMTGLVVSTDYRRRGIASALVANAEAAARAMGHPAIHTATIEASGLIARRGWSIVRQLENGYDILRLTFT